MSKANDNNSLQIIESPRDGWQGIKKIIPTEIKAQYINGLLKTGVDIVEIGSFVSSKTIPQLADTDKLISLLDFSDSDSKIMVLTGNFRGIEKACKYDEIDIISFPFSLSTSFLKKNLNISNEEGEIIIQKLIEACIKTNKTPTVYIAMAFGNPYGDGWNLDDLYLMLAKLKAYGISSISLTDILGLATKERISEVYEGIAKEFSTMSFGLHLHTSKSDFYEKVFAAWNNGCRIFDTVLGGAGGCPMTGQKMIGNLNTLDLVYFCKKNNIFIQHINLDLLNSLQNPSTLQKYS